MPLAVLFALSLLSIGYGVLRVLGVARGVSWLGLAPVVGLAAAAITSSWCTVLGAPPPSGGIVLYGLVLLGLGLGVADRRALIQAIGAPTWDQRLAVGMLLVALAVPLIAMGFAFVGAEVPLSPHDGAAHTETIQAYRLGQSWSNWYPPGTAAIFAAWLQAMPWVDSAQGAVDLGMGLPSLAAQAVFGLGVAVWHDPRIAALASLLLSFTYLFPYFPQIWSGWPLTISLILTLGMWTIALEYLHQDRPSARWGILAGLVLGAIVLVHGTELYTLMIVLPLVLIGARRLVIWRDLPRGIGLALLIALACAAVYLPSLVGWAAGGGAYATGFQESTVLSSGVSTPTAAGPGLFATFAIASLGIDLPIRLILLGAGIVWSIRARVGRTVVAVGIAFAAMAVALNVFTDVALLRQVYALTFPWGMHYRLLMTVTIAQVLLAGAGGVALLGQLNRWAKRPMAWARRLGRVARILIVTWVGLTTWGLVVYLGYPASRVVGYDAADAAAMAWLRANAAPAEVLVNDGYADAGIWAPYKAGVAILLPRSASLSAEELSRRTLVWQNVGRLDQLPEAAAAACAEHVSYVFRGSATSAWDERRFPPPDVLQASPALAQVFSQDGAIVFRTRLACG